MASDCATCKAPSPHLSLFTAPICPATGWFSAPARTISAFCIPTWRPDWRLSSPAITVTPGQVTLPLETLPELNALGRVAGHSVRDENFDIRETADGPVLGVLDRGALPSFGVIGVGVHLNGLVRRADGWHVWIGKRAADKKLDPGKLDNLVAGGVPAGLTAVRDPAQGRRGGSRPARGAGRKRPTGRPLLL